MRIGLTLRVFENVKYYEPRDMISHDWIHFILASGHLPFLIPNSIINIEQYVKDLSLDLIVLTGGETPFEAASSDVQKIRDQQEEKVLNYCIRNSLPIIGICRGMLLINMYFKGTLLNLGKEKPHVAKSHLVRFESPRVIKLFGESLLVNSFHNFAVSQEGLAADLTILAKGPDNTVEMLKHKSDLIWGVMWHPERSFLDEKTKMIHINHFFNLIEVR